MWIRSQDKTSLVNPVIIQVNDTEIHALIDGCENGFGVVGRYGTKERAIEVVDNIQMWIQSLEEDKLFNLTTVGNQLARQIYFVYQMPEK